MSDEQVNEELRSVLDVLADADRLIAAGRRTTAWTWPTGFRLLDGCLGGGLRAGELCLLGGPQGLGKTTFALQTARNVVVAGGAAVVMSYEHDPMLLMERLIVLEVGHLLGTEGASLQQLRTALAGEASAGRGASPGQQRCLEQRVAGVPGAADAVTAVRAYGDRLLLHRSSGGHTGLAQVRAATVRCHQLTDRRPLVVVDYLQKVAMPQVAPEGERVTVVVEGLKDLALEQQAPVLAVVAADGEGLQAGHRARVHHLRGSSALAYESDVVLMMNEKYDVVARHHMAYDLTAAERFRDWVVLSVEKNRSGMDGSDLQLRKRFEQSRFEPEGEPVPERLVDERLFRD